MIEEEAGYEIDWMTFGAFCVLIAIALIGVWMAYISVFEYREMMEVCKEYGVAPLANGSVELYEYPKPKPWVIIAP